VAQPREHTNSNGGTGIGLAAGMEMGNPNVDSGTDADDPGRPEAGARARRGYTDGVDKSGDTALHAAVFRATPQAIRLLAEHDATLDIKNKRGTMPIEDALRGIPGAGVGKASAKPEAAKALDELTVARGLPSPRPEIDKTRYSFGVKVEK
jgi:hypothetical protein